MIFLLSVLAIWRLCHLLSTEDGPWDIIYRIRKRLGNSQLGRLMDCVGCSSIWISIPVALYLTELRGQFVICWLALSGVVIIVEAVYGMLRQKKENDRSGLSNGEV